MKRIAIIIFMVLLIACKQSFQVSAYTVTFNSSLASLIIKELPNEWYFSFSGYQASIYAGIASTTDLNASQYYSPRNASGPLINNAILAYQDLVTQLDKGDIRTAANAFGRMLGYSVYLSNPFRTTDMRNASLATKFEAMIFETDIKNVKIYKNITIQSIPTILASIGLKALNLSSILNKTLISNQQRDENYSNYISIMLSYVASVLYALLMKAISEHKANTSERNLYYMIALVGIILALVIFANRNRLKSIRK